MMPVIAHNVLLSMRILTNAARVVHRAAASKGIEANEEMCAYWVERSAALATALDAAHRLRARGRDQQAVGEGGRADPRPREARAGASRPTQIDDVLDLRKMTEIGVPGGAHGVVRGRLSRGALILALAGRRYSFDDVRITTWAEYGLICALHLARRVGEGPVTGREIAAQERLPGDYVEQILLRLRRAGHRAAARAARTAATRSRGRPTTISRARRHRGVGACDVRPALRRRIRSRRSAARRRTTAASARCGCCCSGGSTTCWRACG